MTATTIMIDTGQPLSYLDGLLDIASDHITHVHLGWGIAKVIGRLKERLILYESNGLPIWCGGTLFEWHWQRNEFVQYLAWLRHAGFHWLEISEGTINLPHEHKLAAIRAAKQAGFSVVSEVGRKHGPQPKPDEWRRRIEAELDAGVEFVQCEGRTSGTVGIYHEDGTPDAELLSTLGPLLDTGRVVLEAPTPSCQANLINKFGPDVPLGNVRPDDVITVATLRRGLRSDTMQVV